MGDLAHWSKLLFAGFDLRRWVTLGDVDLEGALWMALGIAPRDDDGTSITARVQAEAKVLFRGFSAFLFYITESPPKPESPTVSISAASRGLSGGPFNRLPNDQFP